MDIKVENTDNLRFDDQGLIPVVVQDALTGEVLMLAYMNKESLTVSIEEGRTCFYSRSRQKLWRKGEESGNIQRIAEISADCDGDTLLVKVYKSGPACHTGQESCFFQRLYKSELPSISASALYELLKSRKEELPKDSYTTYLFEKGLDKILKKIGEESTEVIIAAKSNDKEEAIYEIADLYYHIMVLMVESGITVSDVMQELASRHIIDKKLKQERMG